MKRLFALAAAAMLALAFMGTAWAESAGSAQTGEAHWVDMPGMEDGKTMCLGTNADGTRFLLGKLSVTEKKAVDCQMAILDVNTGKQTELHLAASAVAGELASRLYMDEILMDPKNAAAILEKYGGNEAFVLTRMWNGYPSFQEASGDYALVLSRGNGYALIDMKTGQTTPLMSSTATLTGNGSVMLCTDGKVSLYDPAADTYTPFKLEAGDGYRAKSARLLKDGTAVCVLTETKMTMMASETIFSFTKADGSIESTVSAGRYMLGQSPDHIYYSERAGVGIAYNPAYIMMCPPRIFHKGQASANVLLLGSVDAARASEADPAETLDNLGRFTGEKGCALLPMGISQDGGSALFFAIDTADLKLINLITLEVRTIMHEADIRTLFDQKSIDVKPAVAMSSLGWNGADLLVGPYCPPKSALVIPLQ